jgi:hypothetical protein
MTSLALSFADDHLERVVLGSAPYLDHIDLVGEGEIGLLD